MLLSARAAFTLRVCFRLKSARLYRLVPFRDYSLSEAGGWLLYLLYFSICSPPIQSALLQRLLPFDICSLLESTLFWSLLIGRAFSFLEFALLWDLFSFTDCSG